ncbi:hypothetical protein [Clostridium ljungdahlii]|uniref:hypothetical protein n=1 Tax=Clostridium ljungdahlii TaxID=1538 RepID=UPI000B031C14|nr:hypothetical protein [Clostridium ljungdahlii]
MEEKEEAEEAKRIAEAKSKADMKRAMTALQNSGVKSRKINKLEKEVEILEHILNT